MSLRIQISVLSSLRVPKQLENLIDLIFSDSNAFVNHSDFEHDGTRVPPLEFLDDNVNLTSLLELESVRKDIEQNLLNTSLVEYGRSLLVCVISQNYSDFIALLVPLD